MFFVLNKVIFGNINTLYWIVLSWLCDMSNLYLIADFFWGVIDLLREQAVNYIAAIDKGKKFFVLFQLRVIDGWYVVVGANK